MHLARKNDAIEPFDTYASGAFFDDTTDHIDEPSLGPKIQLVWLDVG